MSETTHKITIVDTLREELAVRQLVEAKVQAGGELVMEGYSVGSGVKSALGDSDLEYDLAVSSQDVPRVLLQLIRDNFRLDPSNTGSSSRKTRRDRF